MIFTMVLQGPGCLQVYHGTWDHVSGVWHLETQIRPESATENVAWDDIGSLYVTLSSVCRQVYNETSLLPYALNTFTFLSAEAMTLRISYRLPIQLEEVMALKVPKDFFLLSYEMTSSCTFTKWYSKLETLYLNLWLRHGDMSGWTADRFRNHLDDRKKELLKKEKDDLKIMITEDTFHENHGRSYVTAGRST
jgi:hypothetical protein